MIQNPQIIQVLNGDTVHEAKVSWWREGTRWTVEITSQAKDAFLLLREVDMIHASLHTSSNEL
jgi:hypothetical protein